MGGALFQNIQHAKKRAFLTTYALTGLFTKAADAAQCDRTMHYHWLKTDEAYAEAFSRAKDLVADAFEEEASRRALGWDEERIAEDGTSYTIRKYSDTLLIVRLKALKPADYRENLAQNSLVQVNVNIGSTLAEALDRAYQTPPALPTHTNGRSLTR